MTSTKQKIDNSGCAFVAGATGYAGRHVVRALVHQGIKTVAHLRPDSSRASHWRGYFGDMGAQVDETPWDEDAMTATFARLRPDFVFALLGTTKTRMREMSRRGGDPKDAGYEAVDYSLTALFIRAVKAADIAPRFLYLSAVGVSPNVRGAYYRARWKVETELIASGLPYTIVRPSFITGPDREERRPAELLTAGALDGLLSIAGAFGLAGVKDRFQSMTGEELAKVMVRLALDPAAADRVFEAGDLRRRMD